MNTSRELAAFGSGLVALVLGASSVFLWGFQESYEKLSPFSALRWRDDKVEVEVSGSWYELDAIDGAAIEDILEFTKSRWPSIWRKRFSEDLVEVLSRMERPPGRAVRLALRDLDTGALERLRDVPMTEENRWAIWRANRGRRERPEAGRPQKTVLTKSEAVADLKALRLILEERYSYLRRRDVDVRGHLDDLKGRLGDTVRRTAFALEIVKLLALLGDGHTRLAESLDGVVPGGYLPFLVSEVEGGLVAYPADRSGFLDPERPYLRSLDGIDMERWIHAASRIVAQGSSQWIRRQAIRNLRFVRYLRLEMGRDPDGAVQVGLSARGGKSPRTILLPLAADRPLYGEWPRTESGLLDDGSIGYLRLARMESAPAFLRSLEKHMTAFRDTRGLIVDVRGNGGGSRDSLRTFFPYLLRAGDPPRVVNVAAYKLRAGDSAKEAEGYLGDRYLYPLTSKRWTEAERRSIARLSRGFLPEWRLPAGEFSPWHYFVLSPSKERQTYHYHRPVVVLMDGGCFSATDIFLGALKGWPNVTLMGLPSGGGSGRARSVRLPNSSLRIRVSSMASFRPDGRLYDGRGVEPDVLARPVARDLIGATDTMLEAACRRLDDR